MGNRIAVIVTHVDADAIGSLVNIVRLGGIERYSVSYIHPEDLYRVLVKTRDYLRRGATGKVEALYIADLAPGRHTVRDLAGVLREIVSMGLKVYWFDHHIWEESWRDTVRESGTELYIDTTTCATGVVRRYMRSDDLFATELEKIICAIDLWRFDDPRAPWFSRIVSFENSDRWRDTVSRVLITATRPDDLIEWGRKYVERAIDRELRSYKRYLEKSIVVSTRRGIRIVGVVKRRDDVGTSQLAHYLISARDTDIAVILRESGSLSLRSRGYNVRDIAVALGGGGHVLAAGARIDLSIVDKVLLKLRLDRYVLKKILSRISGVVDETSSG